ncbi:MAG: hypothetical protein JWQ01_1084 [Massilia sp.]|nr:hypothetical protein [Massilia sp.]
MQHTLVAVFDNRGDAELAMNELLASGFTSQEVRLSQGDASGISGAATTTGTAATDDSIVGGIKHFFSDLFGTDDDNVRKYSAAVSGGKHVLTLVASSEPEVERAADIVERFGPVDIDEQASPMGGAMGSEAARMGAGAQQQSASLSQQSMQQGTQPPQQGSLTGGSQQRAGSESTAIPVIQEELQVGKREVQRGGVRVFQRVVETPVTETVNLREEHVSIERRPVDQPASSADLAAFQEKTIELRETAEEPVVQKTARVVEEVVVGKEVGQRQQNISETLRHTEVQVEQLGAGAADDTYYRNHYNSTYASAGGRYEDYAPAYSYGSTMAGNDLYRGRAWDDVEPTLRSDWETRNPGSAWEKMKAAVRHGWEKMTS